jgi:hypothetical protein
MTRVNGACPSVLGHSVEVTQLVLPVVAVQFGDQIPPPLFECGQARNQFIHIVEILVFDPIPRESLVDSRTGVQHEVD